MHCATLGEQFVGKKKRCDKARKNGFNDAGEIVELLEFCTALTPLNGLPGAPGGGP